MTPPIERHVIDDDAEHFIMTFNEPGRIEISLVPNHDQQHIIAHAYRGTEIDMEQEPDAVYDGTVVNE